MLCAENKKTKWPVCRDKRCAHNVRHALNFLLALLKYNVLHFCLHFFLVFSVFVRCSFISVGLCRQCAKEAVCTVPRRTPYLLIYNKLGQKASNAKYCTTILCLHSPFILLQFLFFFSTWLSRIRRHLKSVVVALSCFVCVRLLRPFQLQAQQ